MVAMRIFLTKKTSQNPFGKRNKALNIEQAHNKESKFNLKTKDKGAYKCSNRVDREVLQEGLMLQLHWDKIHTSLLPKQAQKIGFSLS